MNLVPSIARLVVSRLGWLFASGDDRDAEILALRHQRLVLQRQVPHPRLTETDRTILAALSTVFDRARLALMVPRMHLWRQAGGSRVLVA
jgi:hypothetical protein